VGAAGGKANVDDQSFDTGCKGVAVVRLALAVVEIHPSRVEETGGHLLGRQSRAEEGQT
jgi:hypothetical protein